MKKKIFVNLVLFLELVMLVIYLINSKFTNVLESMIPFNYIIGWTSFGIDKLKWLSEVVQIKNLIHSLLGFNMPVIEVLLALLLVNIAWIVVFYIIFGSIGAIIKHAKKKKIRKVISEYKLTPTEEKRFAPKNYKKKASRWVGKTLIVPIVVLAILVLARFDIYNIENWGLQVNNLMGFDIYSVYILPVLEYVFNPILVNELIKPLFTNNLGIGYYDLVNTYLSSIAWLEYVILGVGLILVVFIWWGLFKLISLFFRRGRSKHLAKKAKRKYIAKMEKQEYKLRKKYKDDATIKGDEFLKIIEEELEEEALEIAKIKEEKSSRHQKKIDARKKAYLEEIGYGVVDLGVSEEQTKKQAEPIVEREIRYISDADVDIILDEEPVIEIVEEDDMEEVELVNKEDDLFFEKYQEDDVDLELVEEQKPEPNDVIEYVEEKAKPQEEKVEEIPLPIEEKVEVEKYEEVSSDVLDEPIKEEVVQEEKVEESPVEETLEEAPKKVDPFAAYRNRVNKGHGAKKVQSFKDAGFKEDEMMVREDGIKVSIKYDPFAKWRDQERKKGYGAKKVPSFKELQAMKEKEALEASKKEEPKKEAPVKKENPFAKYQNKPKTTSGSKKVPPMKKEEPKVENKEVPTKKENPFAKYQNTSKGGNGSKKVPPMKKEPIKEVKKEEPKKTSTSKNDPFIAYRNKINKK